MSTDNDYDGPVIADVVNPTNDEIRIWARRARRVIEDPREFDREEWCSDRSGANDPDGAPSDQR